MRSDDLDPSLEKKIQKLRVEGVEAPIALGFGISTPGQARQAIEMGADGIITGSACVAAATKGASVLREYLCSMRSALSAPALCV